MWERARAGDYGAAVGFLRPREALSPYLAGRLAQGSLPDDGDLLVARAQGGGPVLGLVFLSGAGLLAPLFGEGGPRADGSGGLEGGGAAMEGLLGLAAFFQERRGGIATAMGGPADLAAAAVLHGRAPHEVRSYLLMSRPPAAGALTDGSRAAEAVAAPVAEADSPGLVGLQRAFEEAEVLEADEAFDEAAALARLARLAREGALFASRAEGGAFAAKGEVEADCFDSCLLGGLVSDPAFRGRGHGRAVLEALLDECRRRRKAPSFFVAPGNAAALGLYRSLGFAPRGGAEAFRIEWYR